MDISEDVHKFVEHVDMSVEDMSYDVRRIVEYYRTETKQEVSTTDVIRLANRFYEDRIISSMSDAEIIADYALRDLYPAITYTLHELGYVNADPHRVEYNHHTVRRYITCRVMMRVL